MALTRLRRLREDTDTSLEKLSGDVGISVSQLSRYESGKRDPSLAHLSAIADHFGLTVGDLVEPETDHDPDEDTLPVVGYVGAGAVYVPFEQSDELDRISRPDWANENTVVAEIRGDSLGSLFDRWLVFFDQVNAAPTSEMVGKLCVVGLADRRVMVKKLTRGEVKGLFTLLSNYEPPIYDVAVEWCAIVRHMAPR